MLVMMIVPTQAIVDHAEVERPSIGNATSSKGDKTNKARAVARSVGSMKTLRIRINSNKLVTLHEKYVSLINVLGC